MKKLIMFAAPLALVTACAQGGDADTDGDGEISSEEAEAEAASADVSVRPGLWETSFEITELEIPNAPPELANMMETMRTRMGEGMSSTSCLTPEEAENIGNSMFDDNDNCTVSEFEMSGGNMSMAATCQEPGGPAMQMTMEGSYTATSAEMTMTANGEIPELGEMRFAGNVTRQHVSDDCGAEADG